jgi:hypothetical protein
VEPEPQGEETVADEQDDEEEPNGEEAAETEAAPINE